MKVRELKDELLKYDDDAEVLRVYGTMTFNLPSSGRTKRFMTTAVVFFSAPNDMIRHKASELGYKVKGKMAPEKFEIENTNLQNMTTEELETLMAQKKAFFNKTD
jgi:hypothetical protein